MECPNHRGTDMKVVSTLNACPACHAPINTFGHYVCVVCKSTYTRVGDLITSGIEG